MKKATLPLLLTALVALSLPASPQARRAPTVDDLLALKSVGGVRLSPDGRWAAYSVTEADLKQDAYVSQIWLAETASGRVFQLTRGEKSCANTEWSPDGRWLTFTSSRGGDKSQLFAIRPDGGEAVVLTKSETGVGGYEWSPDGHRIAYVTSDPTPKEAKDRKDSLGDFEVVRREYVFSHLWTIDVEAAFKEPQAGARRTKGRDFTIGSFSWSPDGSRIAFSAAVNADLINSGTSDIYVLDVQADTVRKIVATPGPDNAPRWSPDGRSIVFSSAMGKPDYFANNTRLALVPAEGGTPRSLTDAFDENPSFVAWTADGIVFAASQKMSAHLFRLDPASLKIERLTGPDAFYGSGASFAKDGKTFAFTAASPTSLAEVYVSGLPFAPRALTRMTDQAAPFILGSREIVSWKSKDGTTIEGVLIKPADFDPSRKYALLCVIHGGPTGTDRPLLLSPDARYYPSDIWAARGALILKVNYRGSAGYGEAFRRLNYRNLGVGDAWDVISGVDCPDRQRLGRPGPGRLHGLEPGRLHLGLPDDVLGPVQGHLGRGGHLQLGHLLLQHRHHHLHPQLSGRRSGRRPGRLPEDVTHDLCQESQDPDAHPARRIRPPGAHPQRLRAAPGAGGSRRPGGDGRLQGLRPRHHQAQVHAGGDAAQPGLVRPLHLRRSQARPEQITPLDNPGLKPGVYSGSY